MKKELQVEQYDSSEVEAKRKKILKIVATGVGATALATVLGYYGLVQNKKDTEPMFVKNNLDTVPIIVKKDTVPDIVNKELDTVPVPIKKKPKNVKKANAVPPVTTDTVEYEPMIEHIMGGNGAWFNSVIEFLG